MTDINKAISFETFAAFMSQAPLNQHSFSIEIINKNESVSREYHFKVKPRRRIIHQWEFYFLVSSLSFFFLFSMRKNLKLSNA